MPEGPVHTNKEIFWTSFRCVFCKHVTENGSVVKLFPVFSVPAETGMIISVCSIIGEPGLMYVLYVS